MYSAQTENEKMTERLDFEIKWNEFSIQQRILCPSQRIAALMELVRSVMKRSSEDLVL
jgi:hypothetical protein